MFSDSKNMMPKDDRLFDYLLVDNADKVYVTYVICVHMLLSKNVYDEMLEQLNATGLTLCFIPYNVKFSVTDLYTVGNSTYYKFNINKIYSISKDLDSFLQNNNWVSYAYLITQKSNNIYTLYIEDYKNVYKR